MGLMAPVAGSPSPVPSSLPKLKILSDPPAPVPGVLPSISSHSNLISHFKHYGKTKSLLAGRVLHDFILRSNHEHDHFLQNCLVDFYGSCGSLIDAQNVFDSLSQPNVYSWNILLHAYGQHASLAVAKAVFAKIPHPDVCSWNTLIKLVSLYGNLDDTINVFRRMPHRNVVSWNAVIAATLRPKDHCHDALCFFMQMQTEGIKPDKFTFVSVIDACTTLRSFNAGKIIHTLVINAGCEQDLMVGTALVNMYGKCGRALLATHAFQRLRCPDDIAWTAMVAAFSYNGLGKEALDVFINMSCAGIKADLVTYVCALDACASLGALYEGKQIHSAVVELRFEKNSVIGTALINMYGKGGSLSDAQSIFVKLSRHDAVTWTVMICSYTQSQENEQALCLFYQMLLEGFHPDEVTYICALDACANLAKLEEGQVVYSTVLETALEQDMVIGNNLVNMYGKCGFPLESKNVFDRMLLKNILSWNTILGTFALNGNCDETFFLFNRMQTEGIEPDDVTFLSVLSACSHGGHVQDGNYLFVCMNTYHKVAYTYDHYVCLIDLLGRAGHLEEAENIITSIPVLAKLPMAWLCLVGASKYHGDIDRGVRAAERCVELDPADPAPCIALLNFYSELDESECIGLVETLL